MWKSPADSPSFAGCDPSRGRGKYQSPKLSDGTRISGINFNENFLPILSNSVYQPNQIATAAESFAPLSEKRQANGCRLFGIELLDQSHIDDTSPAIQSESAIEDSHVPLDAEYEQQHSGPSDCKPSDAPSVSCDPDKSCLGSPHDAHTRQIRSCTKVHLQGIGVGRAVDLTSIVYHITVHSNAARVRFDVAMRPNLGSSSCLMQLLALKNILQPLNLVTDGIGKWSMTMVDGDETNS
ncbi:hypothetical protein SASPL_118720 [Salvia splendens]|uniref:Uncharacterized protein n=1 Tax=Salvia splendens TaxID=180675 RepID=A0A8X8ZYP0_SALSN|nr:hypothetical protein SASPL_118720 [Salvia splendens]